MSFFLSGESGELLGQFPQWVSSMNRGLTICQHIVELLGYGRASLHEVGQHFDAGLVKGQTGTIIDEIPKIRAPLVGG